MYFYTAAAAIRPARGGNRIPSVRSRIDPADRRNNGRTRRNPWGRLGER